MGFGLELLQVLEERPCGRVRARQANQISQRAMRMADAAPARSPLILPLLRGSESAYAARQS